MKHWEHQECFCESQECFCGRKAGYVLRSINGDRVVRVGESKGDSGIINFTECCDGAFCTAMTRSDAIAALREMADKLEGGE